MKKEDAKSFYEQLFSNDAGEEDVVGKAKAFDQIAEKYYFGNFGSVGRSNLDVLMLSIYIERILDKLQNVSLVLEDMQELSLKTYAVYYCHENMAKYVLTNIYTWYNM